MKLEDTLQNIHIGTKIGGDEEDTQRKKLWNACTIALAMKVIIMEIWTRRIQEMEKFIILAFFLKMC